VKFLASGALARGVNKTRFGGTAEAGALPKSSRAFGSAWTGRRPVPTQPSAWAGRRPVPTQPLETRPYTGKLAGEANVRTWTGVLLRQETGRDPSRFSRWCSLVTSKVSVSS